MRTCALPTLALHWRLHLCVGTLCLLDTSIVITVSRNLEYPTIGFFTCFQKSCRTAAKSRQPTSQSRSLPHGHPSSGSCAARIMLCKGPPHLRLRLPDTCSSNEGNKHSPLRSPCACQCRHSRDIHEHAKKSKYGAVESRRLSDEIRRFSSPVRELQSRCLLRSRVASAVGNPSLKAYIAGCAARRSAMRGVLARAFCLSER